MLFITRRIWMAAVWAFYKEFYRAVFKNSKILKAVFPSHRGGIEPFLGLFTRVTS